MPDNQQIAYCLRKVKYWDSYRFSCYAKLYCYLFVSLLIWCI